MRKEFNNRSVDSEALVEEVMSLHELRRQRSEMGVQGYTVVLDAQIQTTEERIATMRASSVTVFKY